MPVTINGTTGITNPDGTAAAPALTGTDTNTGIFFPAADTIAFTEGGVEAMRIDSAGNVGIGTNSPTVFDGFTTLEVGSVSGNSGLFSAKNVNGSAIMFNGAGSARFGSTGAFPTVFLTELLERMRIDTSGNVGIGTNAPPNRLTAWTGGTLPSAVANTQLLVGDTSGFSNSGIALVTNASNASSITFGSTASPTLGRIEYENPNNFMGFFTNSAERMRIDSAGALILAGSTAQKATGTTWSNPSDQRLKDNIRDYEKGIDELMQVRVREWEYNGKGGTVEGTKGLGVVADEVMVVLPDTVENYEAKLNADDEEVTAIKKFDATEITWLLVKTVQEQQALITALTARLDAANL